MDLSHLKKLVYNERWIIFIIILADLIAGSVFSLWTAGNEDRKMRNNLTTEAIW